MEEENVKKRMMRLREAEKEVLSWPLGDQMRVVSEIKENVQENWWEI